MTVGDGVVQITWTKVFILVAALVGMLILTSIIQYTRLGRICRATQQDRRMAAILGINTDRVISWCLSSARRWPVWPACW